MNHPIDFITSHRDNILQTYKDLHALAEPSWEEKDTSAYLKEKLKESVLEITSFDSHYGFIAELKGQSKDVIAIRADMDALMQEVDGQIQPNHSCGHDAHSTMVLYSALALAESKHSFHHTIRFIFQPAEEKASGALQMIKDGALDHVKFLGGIHVRPAIEVEMGMAAPVIQHSSNATITGCIKGVQAHAARPEDGNNPIEAAAILIQKMKELRLKGNSSYSIKMTELHAGISTNAIPETAHFTFDLRAKTNEVMEDLIEKAQTTIEDVAKLTSTTIERRVEDLLPAAVKHPAAIDLAKEAIASVLGEEHVEPICISPGGEDFHFYSYHSPGLAATMIGLGCDLKPGLHHPKMNFNTESVIDGTKILTEMLIKADTKVW
ncbi:amidohydrolase [Domibacillus mangrovi]|uniref:Amidohydrolase n=2 Tax=Domibacillus mangrovi TaxID=1714354 RepID=A0A1Q5P618_9BACI|nr:amidohydrolase [Domibacillus mangrovi]